MQSTLLSSAKAPKIRCAGPWVTTAFGLCDQPPEARLPAQHSKTINSGFLPVVFPDTKSPWHLPLPPLPIALYEPSSPPPCSNSDHPVDSAPCAQCHLPTTKTSPSVCPSSNTFWPWAGPAFIQVFGSALPPCPHSPIWPMPLGPNYVC